MSELPTATNPPSPFVHLSQTPSMSAVRELLEAAAEARRHGDHGAATHLENDAALVLRHAAEDLRSEGRQ